MNNFDTQIILLHLSLIEGVGPATVNALLSKEYECDSLNYLYSSTEQELMKTYGLSAKTARAIVVGLQDISLLERELTLLEKHRFSWISVLDSHYPDMLRHIASAPMGLYVRGSTDALSGSSVSVVGSRDASSYGSRVIGALIPPLVEQGYCIVSGGAQGIDTHAHRAALDAGGRTVVVFGAGLLRPYPAINRRLFDAVVDKGGAIISSFPLQTAPLPGNFPARNRIISGMAQGCLVVQAAAKSGSLITAEYALNQGRHVFAIPGPIDDPRSAGCNELLKQGATLVTSAADIMQNMGYAQQTVPASPVQVPLPAAKQPQQPSLSNTQQTIVDACHQPASFDELLEVTGLSLVQLQGELFDMQLEGSITQTGAGLWEVL